MISEYLASDKLNEEEEKTLLQWEQQIAETQVSIEDIKLWMFDTILAVSTELANNEDRKRDIFLKGRLLGYINLYRMVSRSERAQREMVKQIEKL